MDDLIFICPEPIPPGPAMVSALMFLKAERDSIINAFRLPAHLVKATGDFSVSGSFSTKMYLWPDAAVFFESFFEAVDAQLADLESRRWSTYATRQFRGQPGMRFADLMRGVGRN